VVIGVAIGLLIGSLPMELAQLRAMNANPDLGKADLEKFAQNPDFSIFDINANMGFSLVLLTFVGALVAFYFIFKAIHNREFKTLVNPFSRIRWDRIFFAFFLWLILGLVFEGVSYALNPSDYTFHFKINTFIPLVIISLILLPIQTSTEELLFRGYMMQGISTFKLYQVLSVIFSIALAYFAVKLLGNSNYFGLTADGGETSIKLSSIKPILNSVIGGGLVFLISKSLINLFSKSGISKSGLLSRQTKWISLVMSALIFGMAHSMNPEISKYGFWTMEAYYISAGLIFGIITIMDDGLELALGLHAAQNFIGAVFVGYEGGAIQTDSLLKVNEINPTSATLFFIGGSLLMILVFKFKYNWSPFSKLLTDIDQSNNITLEEQLTA